MNLTADSRRMVDAAARACRSLVRRLGRRQGGAATRAANTNRVTPTAAAEAAFPARAYATFYDSSATARLIDDWGRLHPDQVASSYFKTHAGRFAYLLACLEAVDAAGACLDVAGTSRTKLLFEENATLDSITLTPDVDVEIDDWADVTGLACFDVAVFSEVIEHLNADPAKAIHEINRSLRVGGHLVLTTVNVASELGVYNLARGEAPYAMANIFGSRGDRHQREYAVAELQRLVAAHGFETWATTVNVYPPAAVKHQARAWMAARSGFEQDRHGDTIVVIGRKVADSGAPYRLHPIYHESVSDNARGVLPAEIEARVMTGWPGPTEGR